MGKKSITVLLTACGCPGGPSVARALGEECRIIGVDSNPLASGRYFVDQFYQVPKANSEEYIEFLLDICDKENPDVVLPQSSLEIEPLGRARKEFDAIVMVSDPDAVAIANNKWMSYKTLEDIVPIPRHKLVHNNAALLGEAERLGYPRKFVVLKQPTAKGGRGFWVMSHRTSRPTLNMRAWPASQIISVEDAKDLVFPVLVMEYLEKDESSADTFDAYGMEFGFTKIRRDCRMGLHHQHEAKWDPWLWQQGINVVRALGLEYFANVQFMAGKLLEVNPRISTCLYPDRYNYPLAGVRAALGLDPNIGAMLDGTRAQYYHDLRTF